MTTPVIRVGTGGWTFEPWRDNFYPKGLAHHRELEYASRRLTAIEINATYYRLQKPESFAKWRDATPDGFVFSVKASQYSTNRKVLAEAGESVERFFGSGMGELGEKLGPIVWQFATTKVFDPKDFGAFLSLLPSTLGSLKLRHAVEVRHPSFKTPEFIALARQHRVAAVFADSATYPSFAESTADFVYTRLMKTEALQPTGYAPERIGFWAECAKEWASGGEPAGLPRIDGAAGAAAQPRDVFLFFISGAKERAPAAAVATLERLGLSPSTSLSPLRAQ
ncbi:MAG: DUF72 domain-containing protein [Pseudomonadota bacterium]|nr:DUF72 domain-containing protein [Pseudomonadota bacterium]